MTPPRLSTKTNRRMRRITLRLRTRRGQMVLIAALSPARIRIFRVGEGDLP